MTYNRGSKPQNTNSKDQGPPKDHNTSNNKRHAKTQRRVQRIVPVARIEDPQ